MPHKCDTLFPMTTRPGSTGAAGGPAVCREEEEGGEKDKTGERKGGAAAAFAPPMEKKNGEEEGSRLASPAQYEGGGKWKQEGPQREEEKRVGGHARVARQVVGAQRRQPSMQGEG